MKGLCRVLPLGAIGVKRNRGHKRNRGQIPSWKSSRAVEILDQMAGLT